MASDQKPPVTPLFDGSEMERAAQRLTQAGDRNAPRHDPIPMPVQLVSRGDGLVEVGVIVNMDPKPFPSVATVRFNPSITDMLTDPSMSDHANDSLRYALQTERRRNRLKTWWHRAQFRLIVLGICAAFGWIMGTIFAWTPDPAEWPGYVRAFWGGSIIGGIIYIVSQER